MDASKPWQPPQPKSAAQLRADLPAEHPGFEELLRGGRGHWKLFSDIDEAAELLEVDASTIEQWLGERELDAAHIDSQQRIPASSLWRLVERGVGLEAQATELVMRTLTRDEAHADFAERYGMAPELFIVAWEAGEVDYQHPNSAYHQAKYLRDLPDEATVRRGRPRKARRLSAGPDGPSLPS